MADEKNTVVGESMVFKGEISGDQDLILYGRVEGEIRLSKDLYIRPPSQTQANVKARNVTVSGRLQGNLDADQKVELSSEGKVIGDIRAPRIVIVDGAYFKGSIDMGDESNRPAVPAGPAVPPQQDASPVEEQADTQQKDKRVSVPEYLMGKKK